MAREIKTFKCQCGKRIEKLKYIKHVSSKPHSKFLEYAKTNGLIINDYMY